MQNAKTILNDQNATVKQVQEATKQLQDAIKGLKEVVVVNKSALKEAIDLAKTYKADQYTKESWNNLLEKIALGNKIMEDTSIEDQSVVDHAKVEILTAISKLQLKESMDLIPLEPSKEVVPMTPLKPSTSIDTTKPEESVNEKVESDKQPATGVSMNTTLLWTLVLGAGASVALLANKKRRVQK